MRPLAPIPLASLFAALPLGACLAPTRTPEGTAAAEAARWRPAPGTTWQWQLTGEVDTSVEAEMFDVDLFDVPDDVVATLHDAGRVVVCYFSAGTREDWRADADQFPGAARGLPMDEWPGEVWLDVRDAGVRDVVRARLDHAVARGCDGVEPDNVDAFANDSGFDLSPEDQLDFNRFLAREARARGLSVGLKNDLEQVPALVGEFDWALNEECFDFDECEALTPFVEAGKAVFHVTYGDDGDAARVCARAQTLGLDALIKERDLGAWRVACP